MEGVSLWFLDCSPQLQMDGDEAATAVLIEQVTKASAAAEVEKTLANEEEVKTTVRHSCEHMLQRF